MTGVQTCALPIYVSLDQWVNKAEQYGDSLVYYAAGRKGAEEVSLLVSTDDYSEQKAASFSRFRSGEAVEDESAE